MRKNVKRGRIEMQKSEEASKALRPLRLKVISGGTKNKQPAQSPSSKKKPVVMPLRRSARRAKFVVVQNKKIGRKKGKQTKSGRGRGRPRKHAKVDISEKKKPAEVAWRRKRMQLCRIYWLNGLLLSQKPKDERVTLFRSKKLLVLSGELGGAADQPKCSLCGELEYTPTSNYIACEVCGGKEDFIQCFCMQSFGYLVGDSVLNILSWFLSLVYLELFPCSNAFMYFLLYFMLNK